MHTFFVTILALHIYVPNQNTNTKCKDSKNDECYKRTFWLITKLYKIQKIIRDIMITMYVTVYIATQ